MTERAPRDRCRLPAPSWCLDGRVATSVPTAARIAAADSGLPRGRRALSGALHSDAQVCATELAERRLPSTSLVPGLPTDCELRRLDPNHRTQDSPKSEEKPPRPRAAPGRPTLNAATEPRKHHKDKEETTTKAPSRRRRRRPTWRPARPYIPPGFLLRPPSSSCGKLRERGRSSVPAPHSHEPTNDERSPLCGARQIQAGKSARHRYSLFFPGVLEIPCSFSFVETVFMSGEGCDLVCGEGVGSGRSGEGG